MIGTITVSITHYFSTQGCVTLTFELFKSFDVLGFDLSAPERAPFKNACIIIIRAELLFQTILLILI